MEEHTLHETDPEQIMFESEQDTPNAIASDQDVQSFNFETICQSVASSSRDTRPNLLRRESTEIVASPPPTDHQLTPEELAELNIRVLDYAYIDTGLPPVPHYGRSLRAPRQVVVGPKPVEYPKNEGDEGKNNSFSAGPSHQTPGGLSQPVASMPDSDTSSSQKAKPLEREDTEPTPAESSHRPIPDRAQGYSDLRFYQPSSQPQPQPQSRQRNSSRQPLCPPHIFTNSPPQSQHAWNPELSPSSQQVPDFAHSQESEPYIDTPLVTPNRSFQWETPDICIDAVPELQMDTDSQMPPPEIFSYSQMDFDPQSQADHLSSPSPPAIPPSHFSMLSPGNFSDPSAGPSSSSRPSSPTRQSRSRSRHRRPVDSKLEPESPPAPRYNLRKRQASPVTFHESPPAPSPRMTRSRSRRPFLVQASHSQNKSKAPHSKTDRVRRSRGIAAANLRGHGEGMIAG